MMTADTELDREYTITSLRNSMPNGLAKLTAMGILPGVTFRLIQKSPLPVMQVGYTRYAIDKELYELIDAV